MRIQVFYEENKSFYEQLELEFRDKFEKYEWESLHLRYLIYYMTKYDIQTKECFTAYHYRVSYRIYLMNLLNSVTA